MVLVSFHFILFFLKKFLIKVKKRLKFMVSFPYHFNIYDRLIETIEYGYLKC